jgi:RNA polymerase sigma-70 factor (ECF subfamily)
MEFFAFDTSYVERLRAGDFRTQEHFASYFDTLIKMKLRGRGLVPQAIEDIRQETFLRVLKVLRAEGRLREPEKLGAFVNSTCNNVLNEFRRRGTRDNPLDEDDVAAEFPDSGPDALQQLIVRDVRERVHRVLEELSERDRRLIREVLLEERGKDEVCRELGVDREYLRVLLHRARNSFKGQYLQQTEQAALRR